ncbi:MAG: STAS domain-containing protein [Gammaproteobacteria bacterium]|nr:STAS domain-containing protein [Gammaproteobacteria bacterium]
MITTEVNSDSSVITINLPENFDFRIHREFRAAYEQSGNEDKNFIINLKNTKYMDSSALGMLLLLREYTGNDSGIDRVRITNVCEEVKNILRISKFEKLFKIQ